MGDTRDLVARIKDRMALPESPHPSVLSSSSFPTSLFSLCVLSFVFVSSVPVSAGDLVSHGTAEEARESFSSWDRREEEQGRERLSDQFGLPHSSSSSLLAERDEEDSLKTRPWLRGDHTERKDEGLQLGRERTISSRDHLFGSNDSPSLEAIPDSVRHSPRNMKKQLHYGTSGVQSRHDPRRKERDRGERHQIEPTASEERAERTESTRDGSRRRARQETTEAPQGDALDHLAVREEERIRENRNRAAEGVVNPDKDVSTDTETPQEAVLRKSVETARRSLHMDVSRVKGREEAQLDGTRMVPREVRKTIASPGERGARPRFTRLPNKRRSLQKHKEKTVGAEWNMTEDREHPVLQVKEETSSGAIRKAMIPKPPMGWNSWYVEEHTPPHTLE